MNYAKTRPEELILRDLLARDRTVLANERTLLAYIRTAFGFAAGGVTLIKLFAEEPLSMWMGVLLLIAGFVVVVIGSIRFWVVAARMNLILQEPPSAQDASSSSEVPSSR